MWHKLYLLNFDLFQYFPNVSSSSAKGICAIYVKNNFEGTKGGQECTFFTYIKSLSQL